MITRVQAKNFRSLKYIDTDLRGFQVLIGPNASGKTTFLDVVGFLSDLLSDGLDEAIEKRVGQVEELTFAGKGREIELAVEAQIPEEFRQKLADPSFDRIRYEIALGFDPDTGTSVIFEEAVLLLPTLEREPRIKSLFPEYVAYSGSIMLNSKQKIARRNIVKKKRGGNDNFYAEGGKKEWMPSFNFGPRKSALFNLPSDLIKFPVASWLREFLTDGVQTFVLDSLNIRKASRPGQGKKFKPDGSNLPWVIDDLSKEDPESFKSWLEHIRTALPDIEDVRTVLREDDKHRYLKIAYSNGIEVPSWLVSDGTLRLLALTVLAYLSDFNGVFLIEEPENGIHPKAVETVFQSLSSVYDAQILVASHSPVLLSMVEPKDLLCFSKTSRGITDIVGGENHPLLREWKGESNLSMLFGSGLLG